MIRNILVSQPQPSTPKNPYAEMAEKYGVKFTFRPFIKIEGVSVHEFRKQRVDVLKHTAIVFTSRHAIDNFFKIVGEMRLKMPDTMKYFATSESVALYIQKFVQYRKRKVFFGTTGKVDDLVPVMAKHKSEKYLVPQNDTTDGHFLKKLDEKGLKHTDCVMYRTVSVPVTKEEVFDNDMVVLFTAAGVETLVSSFPGFEQSVLRIATLGNAARIAAEEKGLRIDVVAPLPKQPSITGAIADYLDEEIERGRQSAETKTSTKATEDEEKLRRRAAAKKAAETKRRRQLLNEQLASYQEEVQAHRAHAEDARSRGEVLKRNAEALKKQMEEAQKAYEEARRLADRTTREAEKARREMREAQARVDLVNAELEELEAQIVKKKAPARTSTVSKKADKPATEVKPKDTVSKTKSATTTKKATETKASSARPKTAATTVKVKATKPATPAKASSKSASTATKKATTSAAKKETTKAKAKKTTTKTK